MATEATDGILRFQSLVEIVFTEIQYAISNRHSTEFFGFITVNNTTDVNNLPIVTVPTKIVDSFDYLGKRDVARARGVATPSAISF